MFIIAVMFTVCSVGNFIVNKTLIRLYSVIGLKHAIEVYFLALVRLSLEHFFPTVVYQTRR